MPAACDFDVNSERGDDPVDGPGECDQKKKGVERNTPRQIQESMKRKGVGTAYRSSPSM